jgi:hypothetical protein
MLSDNMEMIKLLDKLLLSKNETVMDALKQAVVLAEVTTEERDPLHIYPSRGPIEELVFTLNHLQQAVMTLQNTMANMQYPPNSGYGTGTSYPYTGTYPTTGGTWAGSVGATGSIDWGTMGQISYPSALDLSAYIDDAYRNITVPNGGSVIAASEDDSEAFNLIDPDTGDSMTVKYK